jgi:hypothetical protein
MAEHEPMNAELLLRTAAACARQEYPHVLEQVLHCDADLLPPRELHPAFFGSYDWHSAVHNHWLLAYGLRAWPAAAAAAGAGQVLDAHLTETNLGKELAFFTLPQHAAVERPYGWAWLIFLAGELETGHGGGARAHWADAVRPLSQHFMDRSLEYLDGLERPIVSGSYNDTAFAVSLMLQGGRRLQQLEFVRRLSMLAVDWFGTYRMPAETEAAYGDFLPVGLTVADLMAAVLGSDEFARWLTDCWPALTYASSEDTARHAPDDPDGIHHYGLYLSRAWSLYAVADSLPAEDSRRAALADWAETQADIGRRATVTGNFLADHWLPTFLTYVEARRRPGPAPRRQSKHRALLTDASPAEQ